MGGLYRSETSGLDVLPVHACDCIYQLLILLGATFEQYIIAMEAYTTSIPTNFIAEGPAVVSNTPSPRFHLHGAIATAD